MTREDLPDHVQAAIVRYIDSVQQVELLALMRGEPDRAWTTTQLCRSLHLSPDACDGWLGRFAAAGIVTVDNSVVRYVATGEEARALDDLVDFYARRRHSVVDSIYSKPPAA